MHLGRLLLTCGYTQSQAAIVAIREGLTEEAKRHRMASTQGDLLDSIRKFFSLAVTPNDHRLQE